MSEPSLFGVPVNAIPTPALVVDLDRLEQNPRWLADYFATRPAKLRPHFKSHKCVELARRQLAAGSCAGTACAKLSEAEQLVAGKVSDILIANQVVGPDKARRLAALNRTTTVRSAVDSRVNARELAAAAAAAGVRIPVLVEVDLGMKRCGVSAGAPALELAREITGLPGLRFDGLQGYEGHLVTLPDHAERARRTRQAFAPLAHRRLRWPGMSRHASDRNEPMPRTSTPVKDAVCVQAVNQFASCGHKRLVLIPPAATAAGDVRTEGGFREAVAQARASGIQAEVVTHDGTVPGICCLVDGLVARPQPSTAFLVSRVHYVLTVVTSLLSSGVKLPAGVALISRDNDTSLAAIVPSLARYSQNPKTFAANASRLVMEMIRGFGSIVEHKIMPTFIRGETLGRPPAL